MRAYLCKIPERMPRNTLQTAQYYSALSTNCLRTNEARPDTPHCICSATINSIRHELYYYNFGALSVKLKYFFKCQRLFCKLVTSKYIIFVDQIQPFTQPPRIFSLQSSTLLCNVDAKTVCVVMTRNFRC